MTHDPTNPFQDRNELKDHFGAQARKIVAVKFGESDKSYDYFCGAFDVAVGQRVMIPMRGREVSVTVAEVKDHSELAKVEILRIDIRTDEQRAARHENGQHVWSPDGTLLDENGNRSIFDDVDK